MTEPTAPIETLVPDRLGPADGVALSRALLAALDDERHLTAAVRRAGRALRDASEALRVGWEAGVRATVAADHGASARRADTAEDAVWLALQTWLKGWSLLPARLAPEAADARAALVALFPRGAEFTHATYGQEWAEADRLLAQLDADGHAATIERLGGASLLRALRTAHAEYERVLHVSHGAAAPADATDAVLAPLADAVLAAVRTYVAAVAAAAREDVAHSTHVADLLAPLRRWAAEQVMRGLAT